MALQVAPNKSSGLDPPPLLWLRATTSPAASRQVVRAHLRHLAGTFRADGWTVHTGDRPPDGDEVEGALAVLDDPWIEALPEAARALARATAPALDRWRVPRLRGAAGEQAWNPRRGPYTLQELRRRAVSGRRLRAVPTPDAATGFAVAPPGTAAPLLADGWPPSPDRLLLVPGVRLYRYDDPADHERWELDPWVPEEAAVVVDVGCGHGRLGARLRRPGRRVIGIEPDRSMAREAARRLDWVLAARAEEALPALASPIDCFVFADVLEHLPDPARVLELAGERLSPDGRIVVSFPNHAWAPVLRDLAAGRWERTLAGVQARDHLVPFTRASLQRLAEECGLVLERAVPLSAPLPWRLRLWAGFVALSAGGRFRDVAAPQWIAALGRASAGSRPE